MALNGSSTRERLLLTAEQLFAVHGIDAISLRQISVAAGQRNNSAAQYHFGSKEGLVRAIFVHRLQVIDSEREQMLDLLVGQGRHDDLRGLTSAMVQPLAGLVDSGGSFYVRFLARVHQLAGTSVYALPVLGVEGGVTRVGRLVRDALAQLPPSVRSSRLQLAGSLVVHASADREQHIHEGRRTGVLPGAAFVSDLVDAVVGIFSAPVSAETRAALSRAHGAVGAHARSVRRLG